MSHNHTVNGLHDAYFEDIIPKEKRFSDPYYLRDEVMRFSIYHYLANRDDTKFSQYIWESNLEYSMYKTMTSALYRVDFNDLNNSEILVYARGYYIDKDGNKVELDENHIKSHSLLDADSDDYKAIENWVNNTPMENSIPIMNKPAEEIVIKEYDEPAYLSQDVTWSDEDGDLAQAMISTTSSSEHTFGDTMLALDYNDFVSAKLKTYAILGDRGEHNFTFRVTDGLDNGVIQTVPVRVESDYIVPRPLSTMPKSYLFYTDMIQVS